MFAMSYISSEDFGEKGTVCVPYTVSSVLGEHGKCDPILREFVIQGRARYDKSG